MFVEWESIPTDGTGTSDMDLTMTMNLRAKLHVYGYAGNYSEYGGFTPDVPEYWTEK